MSQHLKLILSNATESCVAVLFPGVAKDINGPGNYMSDSAFKAHPGNLELTAKAFSGKQQIKIDDLITYLNQVGNFNIENILVLANNGENQNPVERFALTEFNPFSDPAEVEIEFDLKTGKTAEGRYFDMYQLRNPIVLSPLTVLAVCLKGSSSDIEIIFNYGGQGDLGIPEQETRIL
ncbi:hypothetical protein SAMN04515674_101460 [Pseudarcicella hirudinis]|uniref:Uncharacterized protein n=1 Tax=Pseudarcicella hirudinis TaxID=1079859 RepID=A0A1I5MV13_9BACT|nr:hypothetical protein [Pseudarcicella hirudinis]SFP13368.1 hypothetical protein SAMN04515674_101460 [Pseudarcicella hirudinis]